MGERFGNYELLEKVAVGGMAEIFKAKSSHGRGVEKTLCIKRIHPALSADRTFVTMFVDEARLGVTLTHGNIVPVFDFGYVDGHYFLAMEFVEGTDLATLRGRAKVVKLSWSHELALYVLGEILEGLNYVHNKRDEQGRFLKLVHRDVSPSNVLISHDGQVKLLDFGIARSQAREHETRTGVVKGKPGYMSPEQAAAQAVDFRADIWACGAVLHELVTGAKLKDGRRKADDPLIDHLLDVSLAADPEGRYESAAQFQKEVNRVLDIRGWRPGSSDLAVFVGEIRSSASPTEDWDMQSSSVEKHLADVLGDDEPSGESTAVMSEGSGGNTDTVAFAKTRVDTPASGRGGVGTRAVVIAALVVVGALALGFWTFPFGSSEAVTPDPPARDEVILATGPELVAPVDAGPAADGGADGGQDAVFHVAIETTPPGAKIVVNGEEVGSSPVNVEGLAEGEHTLLATKKGYAKKRERFEVGKSKPSKLKFDLKRIAATGSVSSAKKAMLNVSVDTYADVFLDGKKIGDTPIRNYPISAGSHRLVFKNPYTKVPHVRKFTVTPGEVKVITEKMQ